MTIFQSIALAIIEGLSEFLPISSTGHLILTSHVLGIQQTPFISSFLLIIQLGAVASIFTLYFSTLLKSKKLAFNLSISFLPTAIFGFLLYKTIKTMLLSNPLVVVISLIVGALGMLIGEMRYKKQSHHAVKSIDTMTYTDALIIGLYQTLALIPGVSRSAATIIGGLLQNIDRQSVITYSFLLSLPTLGAAVSYDLIKTSFVFTRDEWTIIALGTIVSFITARLTIAWFLSFVERHSLKPFAYYRIIIAILYAIFFIRL